MQTIGLKSFFCMNPFCPGVCDALQSLLEIFFDQKLFV